MRWRCVKIQRAKIETNICSKLKYHLINAARTSIDRIVAHFHCCCCFFVFLSFSRFNSHSFLIPFFLPLFWVTEPMTWICFFFEYNNNKIASIYVHRHMNAKKKSEREKKLNTNTSRLETTVILTFLFSVNSIAYFCVCAQRLSILFLYNF